MKGDNTKLIARQLSQDMAVGMYEAKRLVRTETTYYTNQVAMQGIEDAGLDKYEYLAAHDHRTSEICRGLDGKVFHIKDAKVGVNYPPMHPHCRSTVVAWFGEEEPNEKQALYKRQFYSNRVDLKYIQSDDYARKFDKISDNPDLNKSFLKYAKEALTYRNGTNYESMYILDSHTGELLHTIINDKKEFAISSTVEDLARIEELKGLGYELVAIHNHPNGLPPSADDAVAANPAHRGYKFGVVCGNNGKLYLYKPSELLYDEDMRIEIHNEISAQIFTADDIDRHWHAIMRGYDIFTRHLK